MKLRDIIGFDVPAGEFEDEELDLKGTPGRVTRAWREDILSSYQPGAYEAMVSSFKTFPTNGNDGMVTEGPITFQSVCAHHLLPIDGHAYVGYVPEELIIGASKLARVVEYYSRMLQIQERMARQIAEFIADIAAPRAVIVTLMGQHYCMKCRGVRQQGATLVNTVLRPTSLYDDDHRGIVDEFYRNIQLAKGFSNG